MTINANHGIERCFEAEGANHDPGRGRISSLSASTTVLIAAFPAVAADPK